MNHHFAVAAIVMLSVITAPASARAAVADGDTLRLGEVEILQTSKANIQLLPLDVTTVTQAEIRKSTESNVLPILQNHVAGMFVTERGMGGYGVSDGAAGSVSIRGIGGLGRVLVMVDGQPQWAGAFGHNLPDTYAANEIEKVEVVSGPSSILYGSNAMGGSINLVTRRCSSPGASFSARAMAGSYGTRKYGLSAGYRPGALSMLVAAQYERSDGHRPGSRYNTANQYATASYRFSPHWDAGADLTLTETTGHNPGPVDAPMVDAWARLVRASAGVYVSNTYGAATGSLRLYWNGGRHKINDGHEAAAPAPDYLFRTTDCNFGLTLFQTIRLWSGNDLSAGVDLKRWGGHTWYEYTSGTTEEEVDRHINQGAAYALMQQSLAGGRVSVNAGLRYEHSTAFGGQLIPQAGFILRPTASNSIKFSFGKGYRAPSIRELYIQYSPFGGPNNPDLKAETLLSYELGAKQEILGGRLALEACVYLIKARNLISRRPNPSGMGMLLMNVDKATNKGVEARLSWRPAAGWDLGATYAYLHTDALLTDAPRHKLSAGLTFTPGRWEFTLQSLTILRLRLAEYNVRNYSLLNARAAYRLPLGRRWQLRLFCRADNITDAAYETIDGYPMPGITAFGGIEINF